MSYGKEFRLMLFTNVPELAGAASAAGVDRIGPDLEHIGKAKRQDTGTTWVSDHRETDLPGVYDRVEPGQRFLRCNPVHPDSPQEIDRLINYGAATIMLPMFRSVEEAEVFVDCVGGRARAVLLVETRDAAECIETLAALDGVDEIHIGLNDLHLDLGLYSHFELLTSRYMDNLCVKLRAAGLPFGFGGVGRARDDSLPIPADLIYAQYPRLGATGALVSRVFHGRQGAALDWNTAVHLARERLDEWSHASSVRLEAARAELARLALR